MHNGEDPSGKIIVNNHPHETRYERKISLRRLSGKSPQVIFPYCKRAEHTDQRFGGYQAHGREMNYAKYRVTYPSPPEGGAQKYAYLPSYGKDNIEEVNKGNKIGRNSIEKSHWNTPSIYTIQSTASCRWKARAPHPEKGISQEVLQQDIKNR
jgi:hypothetical protein